MGKPLAGQLGQMGLLGSQTQSQRGGGFGGQQSLSLQKPMQPQMPQQNLFQDFMRHQTNPGGFGNGMGINIAQPPQQSGGLLGSLSPQQNPGGFGNGMGINIAQPPQSGTQAMPQQDMLNAQQQAFTQMLQQQQQAFAQMQQQMPQMPMSQMPMSQMPQMPMAGPGGNRDFYDRQVSPEQRARNEAGMADGSYAAYYQQATGQPLPQQPMQQPQQEFGPSQAAAQAAMLQSMGIGQNSRPDLTGGPMGAPQQMPMAQPMNQPLGSMQDRTNRLLARGLAEYRKMPQQVRPEPPRMQAMRGIQQLASRQRGYNR